MAVRGRPQYMVAIVLRQDENGEKYRDALDRISGKLIARRTQESFPKLLTDSFKWISLRVRIDSGEVKNTGETKKQLDTLERELA
jgi:hypothetical protein